MNAVPSLVSGGSAGQSAGSWEFNEGSGSVASDSSGNGYNGTVSGAMWIDLGGTTDSNADDGDTEDPGVQYALAFDGVNDIVTISDQAGLQSTSGTVCVRVKTSDAGTGWRAIAWKNKEWYLGTYNNKLAIYDFGTGRAIESAANLADGQWHHIAFSYVSGVSNGAKLYVDGVLVKRDSMAFSSVISSRYPIKIGCNDLSSTPTQGFAGEIDSVQYYSRVLDLNAGRRSRRPPASR